MYYIALTEKYGYYRFDMNCGEYQSEEEANEKAKELEELYISVYGETWKDLWELNVCELAMRS